MESKTKLSVGKYNFRGTILSASTRSICLQVLAFLFIMSGVLACKSNTKPQNQQQSANDSLVAANDTIQSKYNAARVQIDQYMTKAAQLDSMIKDKDAEIAKLKREKSSLERSNRRLAGKLSSDKKLISSLRDELSDKSKSYNDRLGLLENDKNDLLRQRDSLLTAYNHVLSLASVLHASNIRLTAIHLKHNGREKNTKRARRADMLRVVFDIDENRIAENGTKKLYLEIKAPDGKLLSDPAAGSGVTTASNGSTLHYSVMKEIPLITNQPVKDVSVDWKQEADYQKGAYTITIYNGGYKIGGGQVDLR